MMNTELKNEIREEIEYMVANEVNYHSDELEEIEAWNIAESIRDEVVEIFEEEELTDDDEEEIFNIAYDLFEILRDEEIKGYRETKGQNEYLIREYERAC